MHESTRRQLCRLLFLALCLVPTLATTAWAWLRRTTSAENARARLWEGRIAGALTVRSRLVSVEQVATPRPFHTELSGVKWFARSGDEKTLFSTPSLRVVNSEHLRLAMAEANVSRQRLREFAKRVNRIFVEGAATNARALIGTFYLSEGGTKEPQTLYMVQWRATGDARSEKGELRFQLRPNSDKFVQVSASRSQSGRVQYELNTFGEEIPCSLLSHFLGGLNGLGGEATFRGTLTLTTEGDHYRLVLDGALEAINLAQLSMSLPQGYSITGRGRFEGRLEFIDGQLASAGGRFSAGVDGQRETGTIDPRWVRAGQQLGMSGPPLDGTIPSLIRYHGITLSFALVDRKFSILVDAPVDRGLGLIEDVEGHPVLWANRTRHLPLIQVLDAVYGGQQPRLPIGDATARISRWFR